LRVYESNPTPLERCDESEYEIIVRFDEEKMSYPISEGLYEVR